jgi:steroid 5-alpha reductase family enzyme
MARVFISVSFVLEPRGGHCADYWASRSGATSNSVACVSALTWVIIVWGVACAFAWIASLVSGDTSWVDRMWSLLPEIYLWIYAAAAHFTNARLTTMAILATLWGVRLTYNFARKGGYNGVEDYRWQVLRDSMPPWRFQLFNLFFIVLYQNVLLVLIALPAMSAYQHLHSSFSGIDALLVIVFLGLLVGETVADQQQWNFHQRKKGWSETQRTLEPGFLSDGLFRFSRHPNYFFEIAQWWVIFAFGAVAAHSVVLWTIIGPVLLTLLFVGSTRFTEQISSSKYPQYAAYQARTSAIVPWLPRAAETLGAPGGTSTTPGWESS